MAGDVKPGLARERLAAPRSDDDHDDADAVLSQRSASRLLDVADPVGAVSLPAAACAAERVLLSLRAIGVFRRSRVSRAKFTSC